MADLKYTDAVCKKMSKANLIAALQGAENAYHSKSDEAKAANAKLADVRAAMKFLRSV